MPGDAGIITAAVSLGVPGLIGAVALLVRNYGEAKVKLADSLMTRSEADKVKQEARRIEAEVNRAREETTGKLVASQREDLTACEKMRKELLEDLEVERIARMDLGQKCAERERVCDQKIAALGMRLMKLEKNSLPPPGA